MDRIKLEIGMRVRCINPDGFQGIFHPGFEERIGYINDDGSWIGFEQDRRPVWRANRFKPVVSVKAGRG